MPTTPKRKKTTAPRITPYLWFNDNAEEAIAFYRSIFKKSKLLRVSSFEGPGPGGKVVTATFELEGQRFHALNGGPHLHFTPAISLYVRCENQKEVDYYWDR